MQRIENEEGIFYEGDIHEILSVATSLSEMPDRERSSRDEEYGFAGMTFEDAVHAATHGDHVNGELLRRKLGVLAAVRESKRPKATWQVSGSQVDTARFLAGEPESMIQVVRTNRQSPVVRILVERAQLGHISSREIVEAGAVVVLAVEALRTAGIPTEIWVSVTSAAMHSSAQYGTKRVHSVLVRVQEASRPIDLDVLAFWLSSPAVQRRLAFSIRETESAANRAEWGVGNTYGRSTSYPAPQRWDEHVPAGAANVANWFRSIMTRRVGVEIAF
jgi:hypothetical protein